MIPPPPSSAVTEPRIAYPVESASLTVACAVSVTVVAGVGPAHAGCHGAWPGIHSDPLRAHELTYPVVEEPPEAPDASKHTQ